MTAESLHFWNKERQCITTQTSILHLYIQNLIHELRGERKPLLLLEILK